MNYSKIVKELREKLLLTQSEFAEVLSVNYTTVSRWEKGLYEPTMKVKRKIVQLCKDYNIKWEED